MSPLGISCYLETLGREVFSLITTQGNNLYKWTSTGSPESYKTLVESVLENWWTLFAASSGQGKGVTNVSPQLISAVSQECGKL